MKHGAEVIKLKSNYISSRPDFSKPGLGFRISKSFWVLVVTALLSSIISLRSLLSGILPGDIGDARWTISIFEHWFRFTQGKESISTTIGFFPFESSLGYSDGFLTPGFVYVLIRMLHVSPVDAWTITLFIWVLIGNIGFALLSTQLYKGTITRIFFVLISGTMYGFVTQLGHVQTIGYFVFPWILFFAIYGARSKSNFSRYCWPLIPPVLALSALTSWYPTYFIFLFGAVWSFYFLVLNRDSSTFSRIWRILTRSSAANWIVSAVVTAVLIVIWAIIYSPSFNTLKKPWEIYLTYAPQFTDIFNISLGNNFWSNFVNLSKISGTDSTIEQSMGLTPVLIVCFLVAFLISLRTVFIGKSKVSQYFLTGSLSVFTCWVLVIVDDKGFSMYHLLWKTLPGATSIRASGRISILLGFAVIMLVLLAVDRWYSGKNEIQSWKKRGKVALAFLLFATIFVEQQRDPSASWTSEEYLPLKLKHYVEILQSSECEAFLLSEDYPQNTPGWVPPIDSVSLAVLSGIPSVLGYSGNTPEGYPGGIVSGDESVNRFGEWVKSVNPAATFCLLKGGIIENDPTQSNQ